MSGGTLLGFEHVGRYTTESVMHAYLPSESQRITAVWVVPECTVVLGDRSTSVNNLPRTIS